MKELVGTGGLIRLILRRDRFILPVRIFFLAIIPLFGVAAFTDLYPTAAELKSFAQLARANLAFTALFGPLYDSNLGALVAWRFSIIAVFAALASFLTVIRHTRTEEETGRRELMGSTVVGRYAPLSSALIVTFGANIALAAIVAGLLINQELEVTGSIALGLSYAAPGWVFAAIAALSAQLTQNAGSARGIAGSILGLSFLLRAVGDVSESGALSWLSWLSPLGWSIFIRSFADENWRVLMLFLGVVIVFSGTAYVLSSRRDVGAGILPPRLGPAAAAPSLSNPLALAWRLQRNLLIAWTVGIALYSLLIGNIVHSIADMLRDNPQLEVYFTAIGGEAGLTDITIAAIISIVALIISIYAAQSALRLRGEEVGIRAEPVLATAVGRLRYAASHLVFAFAGPAVVLAVSGLIIGLTYGSITGEVGREVGRQFGATMAQLPAVWVLVGIAVALYGLLPRFSTSGAWAVLSAFFVIGVFGELLQLPQWIMDISPFTHIPNLPGGEFTITPIIWLLAIALVLTVAGLVGFRQRDIGRV
ncbi:MAG: ABC transporter permease [Actinobacteria bacterium]|nr:ABC transporter permease [Actinomycetota bacterium]